MEVPFFLVACCGLGGVVVAGVGFILVWGWGLRDTRTTEYDVAMITLGVTTEGTRAQGGPERR